MKLAKARPPSEQGLRGALLACLPAALACACGLLLQGCAPKPTGGGRLPNGGSMDCGRGVELCGVLSLETGLGRGAYHHPEPVVHGLWPQTGHYGSSKCVRPDESRDPQRLHSCYDQRGHSRSELEGFQDHEWRSHGTCAGVDDAQDYFSQVCSLSAAPLRVMKGAREDGQRLGGIVEALQRAGHPVWDVDTSHSEVRLAACAGPGGKWRLAAHRDFGQVCGAGGDPPSAVRCELGRRGPPCQGSGDCSGHGGCLRCARSGYCTAEPASFLQTSRSDVGNRPPAMSIATSA